MEFRFNINRLILIAAALCCPLLNSCEKYLDNTDLSAGTIAGTDAFVSDNSVSAIVTGTFLNMASSGPLNFPSLTGLYTDELVPLPSTTSNTPNWSSYQNAVQASNINFWTSSYSMIYAVNAAVEGINTAPVKLYNKAQWLGESYFSRAFIYYYLTNLYGDAALALTTDYTVNTRLHRAPQPEVFQQIIADLKTAKSYLSDDYRNGYGTTTNDRARPNKWAAGALLSKIYLTIKDWKNAELEADSILSNTTYQLVTPSQVFLTNSKETIWSLARKNDEKTYEYSLYNNNMPAIVTMEPKNYSVQVCLSSDLLNLFEANDARYSAWVRTTTHTGVSPSVDYSFPNKYKSGTAGAERSVMLRLADIYLVRAEARARQNKLEEAKSDLNAVRARAGLQGTTAGNQTELLAAIWRERRVELFTELGNRFFDLKRTNTIDEVMTALAPQKGAVWSSFKQVWPIPQNELTYGPNLVQNPGY